MRGGETEGGAVAGGKGHGRLSSQRWMFHMFEALEVIILFICVVCSDMPDHAQIITLITIIIKYVLKYFKGKTVKSHFGIWEQIGNELS